MSEIELDATDANILNLLQQNAALTNKEIAIKTNKSPSSVQVRAKRMTENGVIKKFVAVLDRFKINKKMMVYAAVKIKESGYLALTEFRETVITYDEVMECYHTSGGRDFLLRIVVADMQEYNQFILDKLSLSPYMGDVESFFVISEAKYETAYKLTPGNY